MYLSRLILNPGCRRVRAELADLYELHRTLLKGFPEQIDKTTERVLYRLEFISGNGVPRVLVQSQSRPDWSCLFAANEDYFRNMGEENPSVKEYQHVFAAGQQLRFRLYANPTRKVHDDKDKPKRVGLVGEERFLDWLKRKGLAGGFSLQEVQVSSKDVLFSSRHRLRFQGVQFDGILQVTDLVSFENSIQYGIGSGKGFGFGLLSVARVN
jgi:CRISPR system Cascade subunit CasE